MFLRRLVVTLLLAPAALAQITEKEAQKQFKAATKQATKDFKDASKAARDTADDAIDAFEDLVKDGGYSEGGFDGLAADIADQLAVIRLAYDAALMAIATAGRDALQDLAGPEGLDGVFPDGFYERDRGTLDKAKSDLAKQSAKIAKKMGKDLKKLQKTLAKSAGVGMSYFVGAVRPIEDWSFNQADTFSGTNPIGLLTEAVESIDLVLSRSTLGGAEGADGAILAAGNSGSESITWIYSDGPGIGPADGPDAAGRWFRIRTALVDGNYFVSVFDNNFSSFGGAGPMVPISVR